MEQYWYKKNKTQLLRGFCAVIEEGSILQASKILNVASSSVSLQISSLERDLGFKLFIRENQRIIPTEEAKRLYKVCKKTLSEIDMIFENSREVIKQDYDNTIKLAGHSYMLSHILPSYFKKLIEINQNAKFELHNITLEEAIDMLESGILDFAVYPVNKSSLSKNINFYEFYKCKFGLAVPINHPLSKVPDEEITWNMIAKHDFVTLGKGVTAQGGKDAISSYGVKSRFNIQNGTWEIVTGIVNAGLSCSGTDLEYLKPLERRQGLVIKNCHSLLPEYHFYILTNKKSIVSKSAIALMDIMKKGLSQ
jgi:DNA-binding transcriptional LysR family regulator